jgi:DNA-binding transcriptional MerR regulator
MPKVYKTKLLKDEPLEINKAPAPKRVIPTLQKDYYQNWYAKNGEALNQRRRERYGTEKEYRERVQAWNAKQKERTQETRLAEREAKRNAIRMHNQGSWKTRCIEVDGKPVWVFTIGALAQALGRSISTIRVWEETHVLPPAPYYSERKERLYPVDLLENIQASLIKTGKINPKELRRARPTSRLGTIRYEDGTTETVPLFKVGTLARALGRTVISIGQLEARGYLPETPLRASSLGYRLYTLDMISVAQAALEARSGAIRGRAAWLSYKDEVVAKWISMGITEHVRLVEDESESSTREPSGSPSEPDPAT